MLSATDYQHLVLFQVGDIDPNTGDPPATAEDGVLVANGLIPLLWEQHADKAISGGSRLRFLYVKRDAQDVCLSIAARLVDFNEGLSGESIRRSQEFDHRKAEYDQVVAEIVKTEAFITEQAGLPGITRILATQMIEPPCGRPDALGPRFTGSPYVRLARDARR
jgi:hypothetical protein